MQHTQFKFRELRKLSPICDITKLLKNEPLQMQSGERSQKALTTWHFNLAARWWSQGGSNSRPPACKAGALPAELWPPNKTAVRSIAFLESVRVNAYCPLHACLVGLGGVEPPTSPLSGVRSNQLSYRPSSGSVLDQVTCVGTPPTPKRLSLKEVIQPQVPLGLPCYDFTPVMNHTVVIAFPKVRLTTSGATHSHGVTGGVYKARERIHRGILIRDY